MARRTRPRRRPSEQAPVFRFPDAPTPSARGFDVAERIAATASRRRAA